MKREKTLSIFCDTCRLFGRTTIKELDIQMVRLYDDIIFRSPAGIHCCRACIRNLASILKAPTKKEAL